MIYVPVAPFRTSYCLILCRFSALKDRLSVFVGLCDVTVFTQFLGCSNEPNCFPSSNHRAQSCIYEEMVTNRVFLWSAQWQRGHCYWCLDSQYHPPANITTNPYPTHPSNPRCREVLENTLWLEIREQWQMRGSLFFWVKTESTVRQNLSCPKEVWRMLWENWKRKEKHFRVPRWREGGRDTFKMVNNGHVCCSCSCALYPHGYVCELDAREQKGDE